MPGLLAIPQHSSVRGRAFLAQSGEKSYQQKQHVYHRKDDHLFRSLTSHDWIMEGVKIE